MCLYPKLIKNAKYTANKKNGGVIPPIRDKRVLQVPVGCGECIECRKQKSRGIQIRLLEEIKHDKRGIFVSLTFTNENYEKLYRKCKRKTKLEGYDIDNWIATTATRRMLENFRKHTKKSVKHWLITELGHGETEHIHLHGIMWIDGKEYIRPGGAEIKELQEELIGKRWRQGGVWVGEYVSEKTINYCSKYITKIDSEHKYYIPKILSSPGIGKKYTEGYNASKNKYNGEKTKEYYITNTGHKISMPVYWRNKIYSDDEREKLWLQKLDSNKRFVLGQEIDTSKNDDEYWTALKYAQMKNKELGYGDGQIDWNRKRYEKELRLIKQQARLKEGQDPVLRRPGRVKDAPNGATNPHLRQDGCLQKKDAMEQAREKINWETFGE